MTATAYPENSVSGCRFIMLLGREIDKALLGLRSKAARSRSGRSDTSGGSGEQQPRGRATSRSSGERERYRFDEGLSSHNSDRTGLLDGLSSLASDLDGSWDGDSLVGSACSDLKSNASAPDIDDAHLVDDRPDQVRAAKTVQKLARRRKAGTQNAKHHADDVPLLDALHNYATRPGLAQTHTTQRACPWHLPKGTREGVAGP